MTRKESVLFLKEFCTFSQTLQPQSREAFFKTLNSLGILPALEITLASENKNTKAASIDILIFIVDFSPSMVREYMLQQLTNAEGVSWRKIYSRNEQFLLLYNELLIMFALINLCAVSYTHLTLPTIYSV